MPRLKSTLTLLKGGGRSLSFGKEIIAAKRRSVVRLVVNKRLHQEKEKDIMKGEGQ